MYFKIYGSYFLQSPLCFFMDVIMNKNKGVFATKNGNFADSNRKIIPIIQFILRNKIIHGERNISSLICNGL